MSDDRKDIKLDGTQAVWEMRTEGAIYGTYAGTFRFRCFLTPLQTLAAGREYRTLLGENIAVAFQHESKLAWALAQLKYRVISAPPFWASQSTENGMAGDIADEEVITEVINAAMDAEVKYRNFLKKRKDDAIERAKKMGDALMAKKADKPEKKEEAKDEGQGQATPD
jgi:hypothetical protein